MLPYLTVREATTDSEILKALAQRTGHDVAVQALHAAFVHPVRNQAMEAHRHFFGLREAEPRLRGFALFDLLKRGLPDLERLPAATWRRRADVPDEDLAPEIEEKLDFIAGAHAGGAEPVEP